MLIVLAHSIFSTSTPLSSPPSPPPKGGNTKMNPQSLPPKAAAWQEGPILSIRKWTRRRTNSVDMKPPQALPPPKAAIDQKAYFDRRRQLTGKEAAIDR